MHFYNTADVSSMYFLFQKNPAVSICFMLERGKQFCETH